MNIQFKKGVLELIVLVCVNKRDMYGYELIEKVSKIVDVNDGTIYSLLKRLTNEGYFSSYLLDSTEGPSRKYYKITSLGRERMDELLKYWTSFSNAVNNFIKESVDND